MQLRERLRGLFGPASDESSTGETYASSPSVAASAAADVPSSPPGEAPTHDARRNGDTEGSPTRRLDGLPLAHGQELLGPCRDCSGYWTREVVRGQKPLTCPVCKRSGPPA